MLESNPGKSCNGIYELNEASRGVSTYYWIQPSTDAHQVYCDMCDGHKGGWMRKADLNTSRGDDCPTRWKNHDTCSGTYHLRMRVVHQLIEQDVILPNFQ